MFVLLFSSSLYLEDFKTGGGWMFVKMYQYHIQAGQTGDYLAMQEEASEIYRQYADFHTIYLNSQEDKNKWIEMTVYQSQEDYQKAMQGIDKQAEIHGLFDRFQSLLCPENSQITEESFVIRKEIFCKHK
jgi:hypothetical protein